MTDQLRKYGCTECGVPTKPGEIHTYLFCVLHKQGWTRKQIIADLARHADFFKSGELPKPRGGVR